MHYVYGTHRYAVGLFQIYVEAILRFLKTIPAELTISVVDSSTLVKTHQKDTFFVHLFVVCVLCSETNMSNLKRRHFLKQRGQKEM